MLVQRLDMLKQMNIDEIINLFPDYQKAYIEGVKLLESEGNSLATALTGYSISFKQAKDDGYKATVAECEHMAGERTGYYHKAVEVRIEAIKELLKFILYMLQVSPVQPLAEALSPSSHEATSEHSFSQELEQSTTLDSISLRETSGSSI